MAPGLRMLSAASLPCQACPHSSQPKCWAHLLRVAAPLCFCLPHREFVQARFSLKPSSFPEKHRTWYVLQNIFSCFPTMGYVTCFLFIPKISSVYLTVNFNYLYLFLQTMLFGVNNWALHYVVFSPGYSPMMIMMVRGRGWGLHVVATERSWLPSVGDLAKPTDYGIC